MFESENISAQVCMSFIVLALFFLYKTSFTSFRQINLDTVQVIFRNEYAEAKF